MKSAIKIPKLSLLLILLLGACQSEQAKEAELDFSMCASTDTWPYYHPTLNYEGEFYTIKKHFSEKYNKPFWTQNSTGIVRVSFAINCEGQTGNYKVETCDYDYKPISVDRDIVEQLLGLTKELNAWIPAKSEEGQIVNSHKFFAFKLQEGDLIEIMPK